MTDVERHVIGDALWWSYVPDDNRDGDLAWVRYPITRTTAKRVYYMHRDRETYTDRAKLEERGRCMPPGGGVGCSLSVDGPEEYERRQREQRQAWLDAKAENVRQLRQEAAEAHPDRGGTNEEFIAANARYQSAKTAARRWSK